jgi:hypothetical protein
VLLQDEKPPVSSQRFLDRQWKPEKANVGIELPVENRIPVEVVVVV